MVFGGGLAPSDSEDESSSQELQMNVVYAEVRQALPSTCALLVLPEVVHTGVPRHTNLYEEFDLVSLEVDRKVFNEVERSQSGSL